MRKKTVEKSSSVLKRIRVSTYNRAVQWKKVTELRNRAGLTKTQAAKMLGWTAQQWGDFERGRHPNPRIGTLLAACQVLGCEVSDLLKSPLR